MPPQRPLLAALALIVALGGTGVHADDSPTPKPADSEQVPPGVAPASDPPAESTAKKIDWSAIFTPADAGAAHERVATHLRTTLLQGNALAKSSFTKLKKTDVLVLRGAFDRIGRALDKLKLPYVAAEPRHLLKRGTSLKPYKVICWACDERLHPPIEKAVLKKLRAYVMRGGHLVTTDWNVQYLPQLLPGAVIPPEGVTQRRPEVVAEIEVANGQAQHPLLEGVLRPDTKPRWWFEESWFDARLRDPKSGQGTVLLTAPSLAKTYGAAPSVAILFERGNSRVLHLTAAVNQQNGNLAGIAAIQRLLLNFISQCLALESPQKAPK